MHVTFWTAMGAIYGVFLFFLTSFPHSQTNRLAKRFVKCSYLMRPTSGTKTTNELSHFCFAVFVCGLYTESRTTKHTCLSFALSRHLRRPTILEIYSVFSTDGQPKISLQNLQSKLKARVHTRQTIASFAIYAIKQRCGQN